jgi:hypothetical protein
MPQAVDPFSPLTLIEARTWDLRAEQAAPFYQTVSANDSRRDLPKRRILDPPVGLIGFYASRNHTAIVLKSMDVSLR